MHIQSHPVLVGQFTPPTNLPQASNPGFTVSRLCFHLPNWAHSGGEIMRGPTRLICPFNTLMRRATAKWETHFGQAMPKRLQLRAYPVAAWAMSLVLSATGHTIRAFSLTASWQQRRKFMICHPRGIPILA